MLKRLVLVPVLLLLGACATTPAPLVGSFAELNPRNAPQSAADGTPVRWGGQIVETVPGSDSTCIYALSYPLDAQARPRLRSQSSGRFVACRDGFYDPEVFAKGREITVTGTLDGVVRRNVGAFEYPYPRIAAEVIYLWQRPVVHEGYRHPFYGPYWGPAYRDPFWYPPPRVIVVPVQPNGD